MPCVKMREGSREASLAIPYQLAVTDQAYRMTTQVAVGDWLHIGVLTLPFKAFKTFLRMILI